MNRHSKTASRTVVGRDRLKWRRRADGRLFLIHRNRDPLVTVEPDSKHTGMYRIRFPDGGLSDMVSLTRAKDAALAFALRSLNSKAQEKPPKALHVRQRRAAAPITRQSTKRTHEPPTGFLAGDRS
jgi:hypothetical protein